MSPEWTKPPKGVLTNLNSKPNQMKLTEFDIYLLQESLRYYKALITEQEWSERSIVTKGYVQMTLDEINKKLTGMANHLRRGQNKTK